MRFHVVTLFPEAFDSYLSSSIVGRAIRKGKVEVLFYNPRDFSSDKHRRVDRRPYGGGPGMVLEPVSVLAAAARAVGRRRVPAIVFSPAGEQLTSSLARRLARKKELLLIAGHYEGVDARVAKALAAREISVGPYVLTGGEIPALALIDAVSRFLPGVLGNPVSLEEERLASPEVYTRPESFRFRGKAYAVPKVLRSGDHGKIDRWKASRRSRRGLSPSGS